MHCGNTVYVEPVDISRDDLERGDGATISLWSHSRQLTWDGTCVDPILFRLRQSCFERTEQPA